MLSLFVPLSLVSVTCTALAGLSCIVPVKNRQKISLPLSFARGFRPVIQVGQAQELQPGHGDAVVVLLEALDGKELVIHWGLNLLEGVGRESVLRVHTLFTIWKTLELFQLFQWIFDDEEALSHEGS